MKIEGSYPLSEKVKKSFPKPKLQEAWPVMVSVKSWCSANRNERGEVNLPGLAKFIHENLKQNPQRVIELAFDQAILMRGSKHGKAVVM